MFKPNASVQAAPRILYLDVLRVLSIAGVILLHAASYPMSGMDATHPHYFTLTAFTGAMRFAVPVMVMISGALFLNPARSVPFGRLLRKNVGRLALLFIVFSPLYALGRMLLFHRPLPYVLKDAVLGPYHFWFLFMLAGLYISVPLLRLITAQKRHTEYFLLLSFLFAVLLPNAVYGLTLLETKLLGQTFLTPLVSGNLSHMGMQTVSGYAFYFVLGHYLHACPLSRRWENTLIALGCFAFPAMPALNRAASLLAQKTVHYFSGSFTVPVTLMAAGVFLFIRRVTPRLSTRDICRHAVLRLSALSLGAFVVHAFLLDVLARLGWTALSFHPLASVPLIFLTVCALSFALSDLGGRLIKIFQKR